MVKQWLLTPTPCLLIAEAPGRGVGDEVTSGAAACRWPGRLEPIELGGRRVLLDAAHNAAGAAVLAEFLDRLGCPVDLLFGVLADKDYGEMLSLLASRARRIVLTVPPSPRAKDPAELAQLLGDREGVFVEPDPARALDQALALGGEVLVVCGSIYLVGEIRKRLNPSLLSGIRLSQTPSSSNTV